MKYLISICLLCSLSLGSLAFAAEVGNITVINGLVHDATLKPGGRIEGRILVRNTGTAPQEVKAHLTDYRFYADGRNLYGDPGKNPRTNAGWITFSPSQFIVPPQEMVAVEYIIEVSRESNLTGTYWSMMMIEPIPSESLAPPAEEKGKIRVAVQTIMRYGIQMITTIADTGKSSIQFIGQQLLKKDDKLQLVLDIEDTGERTLVPLVWMELFDAEGKSLGRFEGGKGRMYPGCSNRFCINLPLLSPGVYTALVVADNGDDHVFGAKFTLEIK
ncbi:MAG: hypothetical protein ACYDCO_03110 [Armatimonadota bacterium]